MAKKKGKRILAESDTEKRIWIPQIPVIGMLLWAFNPDNPYGYYILLRWVCCGVFAYLALNALKRAKQDWVWILGITALIYNPIFSVHLTRGIWQVLNAVTIIIAIATIIIFKKQN